MGRIEESRHYSEKGGHLFRGFVSRQRPAFESAFPGMPFYKPLVTSQEHYVNRRFMMRSPNSGKSKKP